MKKINISFVLVMIIFLTSCQSVKDGLSGRKSENSDEFLVQKKNPLVLPPDYSKLPLPKNVANNNESSNEFDLEKKLKQNTNSNTKNSNKKITDSFEKMVIEKIKKD